MRFNGPAYKTEFDQKRLTQQHQRIFAVMLDGEWRTLDEIAQITGDPEASISAQLRHMRKKRFGGHTVNRRNRGDRMHGHFEYQLIENREGDGDDVVPDPQVPDGVLPVQAPLFAVQPDAPAAGKKEEAIHG